MALPVSHIIYADKYFDKHPSSEIDKDYFVLGCTFPDIRRIDKNIRRKDTHLAFSPVDLDFSGLDSFQAGWKFHLYCDMKREEILNKYDFYSLDHTTDFWNMAAKLLEDKLIYKAYNNWEKVINYYNNSPDINNGINVPQETIELWHAILAKYFEKNPDSKSINIFLSKTDLANKANDIVEAVEKLAKDDKVVGILKKIKDEII